VELSHVDSRVASALFPGGEKFDFVSHFGGVVKVFHGFFATSGRLRFLHEADVLALEVGNSLLHGLIWLRALQGSLFYRPISFDRQKSIPHRVNASFLIPNLVFQQS
jgi:hypothetical protein